MSTAVRVFLVDDHPVVIAGLTSLLAAAEGIEFIGSASSGEQALEELRTLEVDVVLLDHRLGNGMDGVELTQRLSLPPRSVTCVALTAEPDAKALRAFLAAGATGLLLKQADPGVIVQALRCAAEGAMFVDPRLTPLLMHEVSSGAADRIGLQLGSRERALLHLMADGLSNQEIALELGVSMGSVKSYVSTLLRQLGAMRREEAIAIAIREGVLPARTSGRSS